jgi:hypothetical protein
MNRGRIALLLAGLLVAIILAFFLQDVIRQAVVTPLAYTLWVLKLAYTFIPQLLLWFILLAVFIFLIISSLLKWYSARQIFEEHSKPAQGSVEILAGWVSKARKGNYHKWKIANRLGKLWSDRSGQYVDRRPTVSPDEEGYTRRDAQEAVKRYLKAGLDESFVDYPLPSLPFMRKQATPFDLNVDEAVEFLESSLEVRDGE